MHAKNAVKPCFVQLGEVSEGAKAAIRQEHVTRFEFRVHAPSIGQIVRSQGRGQHLLQQSGAGVKQTQQVSHRKTAARLLGPRLTKRFLQGGRVGHRTTGTVEQPNAMLPAPALGLVATVRQGLGGRREQPLEQGQGQATSCLAVSVAGEAAPHQVRHLITGGVAVQDLKQEGMHGDYRRQDAFATGMAEFAAGSLDQSCLQVSSDIRLDLRNGAARILVTILGLLGGVVVSKHIFRETSLFNQARLHAKLRRARECA